MIAVGRPCRETYSSDDRLGLVLGLLVVVRRAGSARPRRPAGAPRCRARRRCCSRSNFRTRWSARRLEHDARAADVDVPVVLLGHVHLAERGGQVVRRPPRPACSAARRRGRSTEPMTTSAPQSRSSCGLEPFLVVQGDDLVAVVQQPPDQRLAREPRAAGDEYPHVACSFQRAGRRSAGISRA